MATVDDSFRFCSLFEAELLLELMLRYWGHPCADDAEFRNDLIESATEALRVSMEQGIMLITGLSPSDMNFVAAV